MFKYLPLTEQNKADMLKIINVKSVDDLLYDVPKSIRLQKPYDILPRLSESQIRKHLKSLQATVLTSYRGYGVYEHERPSIIDAISSRQEFLTSYTPYQPEVAQGTLQYIFEWQSMMVNLTEMDVSNASMYDGATALSEAMMMAVFTTNIKRVLVASPLLPHVEKVLKTYARHRDVLLEIVPHHDGKADEPTVLKLMETPFAAIIIAYPNRFGLIEYSEKLIEKAKEKQSLVISYNDPFALARLKSPRSLGVDIACGEAQSLGLNPSFGGPFIGYLTTTQTLLRKMPGRICGYTTDSRGQRSFVLTLQTREQHIRREKANSNICSNQSLLALQATIYLATLGKQGLVAAFDQATKGTHYLKNHLVESGLFSLAYHGQFAYEITLKTTLDAYKLESAMVKKGYLIGQVLYKHTIVFYVSESRTKDDIDAFVSVMMEVAHDIR
jgi:glycine dehydrogenase subunit 1